MTNIKPFVSLKHILSPEGAKNELPSYLNLWAVAEESVLVGVDGQLSLCYEIVGADLLLMSEAELSVFYTSVKNALNVLPENVTVQFVVQVRRGDDALIDRYKQGLYLSDDISNYLADVKTEFLRKAMPYRKRYLMYITVHPGEDDLRKLKPSLLRLLYPDFRKLAKDFNDKYVSLLREAAGVFSKTLVHAGVQVLQLNEESLVKLLYEHLNPGRSENLEIQGLNREHTLRSQLVYNAGNNLFSHYSCDGFHYRAVNLYVRPDDITFTYLPNLIGRLDDEYDIVITAHKVNKTNVFEGVTGLIQQRTIASLTNFNKGDENHAATQKVNHITQFIKLIETSKESVFDLSFCVVLRDTDLVKLKSRTDNCLAGFKDISNAEGVIDDMNHFQLYLSAMPGHSMYNPRRHVMSASAAAMFLPLFQYWKGCDTPQLLYNTRQNELFPIDLFERKHIQASNMLGCGTTGSGKSFNCNSIVGGFYLSSPKNHVIVLDPSESFKNICNIFGGQYFDIGFSDEYGFNPLPPLAAVVKNPSFDNFEMDTDWLAYIKDIVWTMLNKNEVSNHESMILERAIKNTYRYLNPGVEAPILSNLHFQLQHYRPEGVKEDPLLKPANEKTLSDDALIARSFAENLALYTEGDYSKLFNRHTTIKITSRFTVFGLKNLKKHSSIQKILVSIIRNLIWNKLYDKSIRKLIVMDEIWSLMDPVTARLIEELYRLARAYNGAIFAITQNIADIDSSPVANAVKANTHIKMLMYMKDGHDKLPGWQYNDKEIAYIKGLKTEIPHFSEMAIKYGDKFRILRLSVSKPEYWVFTSDPGDFNKSQALRAKYPAESTLGIIKRLAAGEGA